MMLQQLWERYSYVILLLAITFICGFLYLHMLTDQDDYSKYEENPNDYQIVADSNETESITDLNHLILSISSV